MAVAQTGSLVNPSTTWIALRIDNARVLFLGPELNDAPALSDRPAQPFVASAEVVAKLHPVGGKMPEDAPLDGAWLADAALLARFSAEFAKLPESGAVLVDAGPYGVFRADIAKPAIASLGHASRAAGIARIIDSRREEFAALDQQYMIVRTIRPREQTIPAQKVGPIEHFNPSARDGEIRELLNDAMADQLPRVIRDTAGEFARDRANGAASANAWKDLNARLQRGEGHLDYDVRAFGLTSDAAPRLFVRAEWKVAGRTSFLMSAWMAAAKPLRIEALDVQPSRWLRMPEFQSETRSRDEWLGDVLNVFDLDRDGWGEVLMQYRAYESWSIVFQRYTRHGPEPTGIDIWGGT